MATKEKSGGFSAKPPVIPEAVTRESVAVIEKKSISAVDIGAAITVKDDKDLEAASKFLSNLKTLQKLVKQEKDKRLNPVKEIKDWIVGIFDPIEERIKFAEDGVKRVMAEYHDRKTAEAAKEAARIARQEEAGRIRPETAVKKREEIAEVRSNVKTTAGTSTFSKIKKVRVVDPALQKSLLAELFKSAPKDVAERLVPAAYWVIDETTLRAAALTEAKTQGRIGVVIPGAEVYEETVVGGR